MAVEKLVDCEIPPRAQRLRLILNELERIASHLLWLGTHALDIGAMTLFFYTWRERDQILDMKENDVRRPHDDVSWICPGGLRGDMPPKAGSTRSTSSSRTSRAGWTSTTG